MKIIKITILSVLVVCAVTVILGIGGHIHPRTVYQNVEVDKSSELFAKRIDALKNDVVGRLRACESAGFKETDGLIVFDTNKKASLGTLQWQIGSVQYYKMLFEKKQITGKEAVLIAMDDKQAGELAKRVMFETKNMASKDWLNCATRLNLDSEIAIIKKLETK